MPEERSGEEGVGVKDEKFGEVIDSFGCEEREDGGSEERKAAGAARSEEEEEGDEGGIFEGYAESSERRRHTADEGGENGEDGGEEVGVGAIGDQEYPCHEYQHHGIEAAERESQEVCESRHKAGNGDEGQIEESGTDEGACGGHVVNVDMLYVDMWICLMWICGYV